ncbi:proline--tRNA ligase [Patescibacteria group bacterium]|nr:proline--tRNA ligase [Patescibacteria group bacterium]MBU4453292.1 proline--tRNA ligase [Patescibacteria group bacterium]MCG2687440.1 proline--tRNA ligase [Candidatus Parcubacteria bacterium]
MTQKQNTKADQLSITNRDEDFSKWYLDIIEKADLAEHSPVKGCMVIKPYGYAIWENIQKILNKKFKETGHENAYFPLLIPKSFLSKEASHVKGFAKECAVVTHYRLIDDPDGTGVIVDPESKLEEELIIRPTSETIIYDAYSRWVQSWRDLPILINQWANVVRWEMRTRLFLRTAEFLWQEGHTAHATEVEAEEETVKMLQVYEDFAQNYLAMPVITGLKPEHDKFPGALRTYCIEAMMQDKKSLQAGTSHNLGQNFAKAFDIKFTDQEGKIQFAWQTSWGVSTRLIGGLIMTHSDDKGLVLPPRIAPIHVVIVPIYKTPQERVAVAERVESIKQDLLGTDLSVKVDDRDNLSPGFKFNEWEKKGVPIRMEIGPKDLEKNQVVLVRRDTGDKSMVAMVGLVDFVKTQLNDIQENLMQRAMKFREENSHTADNFDQLVSGLNDQGGYVYGHWCGDPACEDKINKETSATIRCLPIDKKDEPGKCAVCGKDSKKIVIFAKAY